MTRNNALDDEIRSRIESFIGELSALVKVAALEAVHSALGDAVDASPARRGPGRPRGSTSSSNGRRRSSGAPKRRRRRRGGTRADQALKHVTDNPGIRASEIASKMNIKPNDVYRVMSELESDGKVKKKGREYHPASSG